MNWKFWQKPFVDRDGTEIECGDLVLYHRPDFGDSEWVYLAVTKECGCKQLCSVGRCHYDGCDHSSHFGSFRHIAGSLFLGGGEQDWQRNSDFPKHFKVIGDFWRNRELLWRDSNMKSPCWKNCGCQIPPPTRTESTGGKEKL